jgi:hypothetical protein
MAVSDIPKYTYYSDDGVSAEQSYGSEKNSDGTTTIDELSSYATVEEQKLLQKKNTVDSLKDFGEINWLGSSYSGQDIRVVAHLYGSLKEGQDEAEIENDITLQTLDALVTGTGNLTAGNTLIGVAANTNSFTERRAAFDAATGLGDSLPEQRAKGQLRAQVLSNGNFNSFVGVAKIKIKLDEIRKAAELERDALRKSLEAKAKLREQSSTTLNLGTLQTLSVQTHREKFGVRALGHSYVKGYTRGPRTIAGSMIFTLFDEHPLKRLLFAMGANDAIWKDPEIATLIPDQIPPIDLTIIFANEYGSLSRMSIYGVEFINDGATFSVDDLLTENVMNFMARDVDVMTKVGQIRLSRLQRGDGAEQSVSGSQLIGNDDYLRYLDELKVRRRLVNR